jgi:hypothetical protein
MVPALPVNRGLNAVVDSRPRMATTCEACGRLDALVEAAMRRVLEPVVEELRAFVDRRLAEVSAEINAAVQIVDFSESALAGQLAGIQQQVAQVLDAQEAAPPGSGLALENVVEATGDAAQRIIEAAEAINHCVGMNGAADATIRDKLGTIFSACGFHDLAGQRVRRAIAHLQLVEGAIAELASLGPDASPAQAAPASAPAPALRQGEVDKLFE